MGDDGPSLTEVPVSSSNCCCTLGDPPPLTVAAHTAPECVPRPSSLAAGRRRVTCENDLPLKGLLSFITQSLFFSPKKKKNRWAASFVVTAGMSLLIGTRSKRLFAFCSRRSAAYLRDGAAGGDPAARALLRSGAESRRRHDRCRTKEGSGLCSGC